MGGYVASGKPALGGGVYHAPAGTALPTTASTALAAAYKALGAVSTEGLKPTRDTNVEKIRDWSGDVVASLLTDTSASFAFTLIDVFAQEVNNFVYDTANVTFTPAATGTPSKLAIVDKGTKPIDRVMVFEMRHGAKKMRIMVPVASPVISGEGAFVADNINSYEVEVEAIKDASGNRVYRYYENDDPL